MAITLTHLQAVKSAETVTTLAIPSFTLPANRLGIICITNAWGVSGGPHEPTIPNWTAHTFHLNSGTRRVTLFTRVVGSDTTEGLTVSFGGNVQSFVTASVLRGDANVVITGTAGADGIVQALGSSNIHGPTVNATPTLTALSAFAKADNASLSFITIGYQANAASVGTGFTELSRVGVANFSNIATITQWKDTNDTVHELTGCTNSSDMWIGIAVELAHVSSGTPPLRSIHQYRLRRT